MMGLANSERVALYFLCKHGFLDYSSVDKTMLSLEGKGLAKWGFDGKPLWKPTDKGRKLQKQLESRQDDNR